MSSRHHARKPAPAPLQPLIVRKCDAPPLLGLRSTRFDTLSKEPGFPKAVQLGPRARGYIVAELLDWARGSKAPAA